ncbi:MAG: hypothetical protein ALECFALPRED_001331 [Alectoria fallacina]|uniref:CSD domain-containing protein n=1 Tax=Alectoria fallacina TaxID=1903189 RepID=A0A8H3I9H7_9LECA|nr:MAG: hypothetical protein ALECFALPRED_001331 [Alectoria fallacina]
MADRETGTVKVSSLFALPDLAAKLKSHQKWSEKGFGFIERDGMSDSIFVHARDTADRQALIPGSKVSFVFEADEKSGKAKEVLFEEMAEKVVLDEGPRERGTVKRWNAEKGFGFIGRTSGEADAFFHRNSFEGYNELYIGQAVSFIVEKRPKGAAATKVKEEGGGLAIEEEGERETGKVKRWNAEKGFGFVGRASGEEDAFFHKKSFAGSQEPYVGQVISFVVEGGPKGAAAMKVKGEEVGSAEEEEKEGVREMGMVKFQTYSEEKGFAFITRCFDATEIFGHKREFEDVEPYVGQPVSFVYEVTEKGGAAKKALSHMLQA